MGIFSKILNLLFGQHPADIRPLTAGRAVFRISGIERLPFGHDPGELDNWVFLTMLWQDGLSEGPALELALRGTDDEAATSKPIGDKVGLVGRWSPNLAEDNRLYKADKHRPESDYLGQGVNYHRRIPLGRPTSGGGYLITVDWNRSGVMLSTQAGSVQLAGKHPEAAGFGYWAPGALGIGWATKAQDATRRGLSVRLERWSAVGPQPDRVLVP